MSDRRNVNRLTVAEIAKEVTRLMLDAEDAEVKRILQHADSKIRELRVNRIVARG